MSFCSEIEALFRNIEKGSYRGPISPYSQFLLKHYCLSIEAVCGTRDGHQVKKDLAELLSRSVSEIYSLMRGPNVDPALKYLAEHISGSFFLDDSLLSRTGYRAVLVRARLVQRAIYGSSSGLGRTAFEVGLEFDPIYGVPVIRGSAVKGAVRTCAERDAESSGNDWERVDAMLKILLGSEPKGQRGLRSERSGSVVFLDGYPVPNKKGYRDEPIVVPDVITPHYIDVKRGREILDEARVTPVPLVHCVINFGTIFVFPLIIDLLRLRSYIEFYNRKKNLDIPEGEVLERLCKWIDCAFGVEGIGARTSVGYGVFKLRVEGCLDRG